MPTNSQNASQAGITISRDDAKWGNNTLGTSAVVSYGYRPPGAAVPAYTITDPHNYNSYQEFTAPQKAQAEIALALWSDLANITFVFEQPGSGLFPDNPDVFMTTYFDPNDKAQGFAFGPDNVIGAGDVWIDQAVENSSPATVRPDVNMPTGSYLFESLVHEIGHALGLSHPGEYNAGGNTPITYANNAAYIEDSRQFSIMSYFNAGNTNGTGVDTFANDSTPMLHDIIAIQRLYGANYATRSSFNTYGFNGDSGDAYLLRNANDKRAFAIWDGGGVDTLDFSGYAEAQLITLQAATANQASSAVPFSSTGGLTKNVVIAPGVVIEHAIGGSGSDQLFGNQVANTLNGGGGADFMSGGLGADTYYVDNAGDNINDIFASGIDDFALDGVLSSVSFSLMGTFAENLSLRTGSGNLDLTGNASVNILSGNEGSNTFRGNGGGDANVLGSGDIMRGGLGNDVYYVNVQDSIVEFVGGGQDTVRSHDYTLAAGVEVEILEGLTRFGPGAHLVGNEFANTLLGGTGFDVLEGGAGDDIINGHLSFSDSTNGDILRGGAGLDQIFGDEGGDTISGGDDADTILAWGGDDTINGGSGADNINGGNGEDTVGYSLSSVGVTVALQQWTFTTNNPLVISIVAAGARSGDAQGDILSDVENIVGSDNADTLVGNYLVNKLYGDFGNDRLAGGDGNDFLYGQDDADRLEGGLGNDELYGDISGSGPYGIPGDFTPGSDILFGNEGNDRLQGGQENDSLYGGDGNDILIGNEFAGDLSDPYTFASDLGVLDFPGFGLDTADVDFLSGGAGNDIYYLGGKEDIVSEAVNGGTDELRLALHDSSFDLSASGYENIENMTYLTSFHYKVNLHPNPFDPLPRNLISGTADFVGIGNTLANKITGADMWDTLSGLGGNDTLIGGVGVDTLNGGADNDTLIGGVDGDILNGGGENDTVSYATSAGSVVAAFANVTKDLFGNLFVLVNAGFRGNDAEGDVVSFCENITGSAFDDTLAGNADANILTGGKGHDTLYGGLGADTLSGGFGNDRLDGGSGVDIMSGGAGDDTFEVNDVGDIASEQSSFLNFFLDDGGIDTVNTTLNSYTLNAYIEKLNFRGIVGDFVGTGNASDNIIIGGNSGQDILSGGAGADNLNSGLGSSDIADYRTSTGTNVSVNLLLDTASGGHAQGDTLDGIDGLYGSLTQRDILIGDNASNILKGYGGNDSLVGNDGDDFIEGGAGGDAINGGAGVNDWASYRDSTIGQVSINLLTATHSGGDAQGDSLFFIENLEGSLTKRDILIGNIVANRIIGNGGVDTIQGGDGNDFIDGGTGGDSLNAGAGIDTLSYEKSSANVTIDLNVALQVSAGDANGDNLFFFENVTGSDFGDNIKGNYQSNRLAGGLGADTLNGGTGSDYLTGGADADTFRFTDLTFGSDTILDWQDGSDKISLALSIADAFSDFTITGNGTAHAVIKIIGVPGSAITVNAAAPFTLDAGDFVFV